MALSRDECLALDARDPLAGRRELFALPEGLIYLDGNSLGALPKAVGAELARVVEQEWGRDLISSWNAHGWIELPRRVGAKLAPLLGAAPDQVIAADSTSVNLFKLLAAALELRPGRRVVLSTADNFPTDLYIAQGLETLLGRARCELRLVATEELAAALDHEVAVLLLTQVDFRSGRLLDMATLTRAAHAAGAVALWDLAHSAGALPLALDALQVDLAVGCGYKYLNGGPGAPAFAYVARRHHERLRSPLWGWMGHAAPFDFSVGFAAGPGMDALQVGTPSVLAMRALDRALDVWDGVDLEHVREKSLALSELLITRVAEAPALEALELRSPPDPARRGSQVAFAHPHGYAIVQALAARGVVGDFREPDLLRFGLTPLYLRHVDVWDAVARLEQVLAEGIYQRPEFRTRARVT